MHYTNLKCSSQAIVKNTQLTEKQNNINRIRFKKVMDPWAVRNACRINQLEMVNDKNVRLFLHQTIPSG